MLCFREVSLGIVSFLFVPPPRWAVSVLARLGGNFCTIRTQTPRRNMKVLRAVRGRQISSRMNKMTLWSSVNELHLLKGTVEGQVGVWRSDPSVGCCGPPAWPDSLLGNFAHKSPSSAWQLQNSGESGERKSGQRRSSDSLIRSFSLSNPHAEISFHVTIATPHPTLQRGDQNGGCYYF